MPKLRVHNFAISLDGYGTGPNQSREDPLGVGGERLHEWMFEARTGRQMQGRDGGSEGLDDDLVAAVTSASAPPSWDATCPGLSAGRGVATTGVAGGATTRRTGGPEGYDRVDFLGTSVAHFRLYRG